MGNLIYNIEPAQIDLFAIQGDTIDMTLYVTNELTANGRKFFIQAYSNSENGTAHDLGQLIMQVRRKDGLLIKEWYSNVSPESILISGNTFYIYDQDGFDESGLFDFSIEENEGGKYHCIATGQFYVKKEITI
jgi:hypothetical protein